MKGTPEQIAAFRRQQWLDEQAREVEAAKAELAAEHGLDRNEKFEIAWGIAWEHGHSSGIPEVKNFFHDLVPLLK